MYSGIKKCKLIGVCLLPVFFCMAQPGEIVFPVDSVFVPDSIFFNVVADNVFTDTLLYRSSDTAQKDTGTVPGKKLSVIEAPVVYSARDSLFIDLSEEKIYLYGDAKVTYQAIELTAAYIEFGMRDKSVYARGMPDDSSGKIIGKPVFKDEEETFEAKELTYNFNTKQGVIKEVITDQEGVYMHGDRIKRHANEHIHIKNGKYTTCDAECPHFYLAMSKAKVIPQDKIVSGPAYLVVEDVPLYFIGLPFGFFPNTKKNKSGILVPEYGEEQRRGFFLKNGGYYFALGDHADLKLTGAYYTNKSWGVNTALQYTKRYKFRGSFDSDFYRDISSEKGLPDYLARNDMSVVWRHDQDPKANPYNRFTANVNFSNSSFDKNQSYTYTAYTTATKSSNIAFNKTFPNSPFSASLNLRHSQNSQTQKVDFKIPELAVDMQRQFPFKRKNAIGQAKWYEEVQVGYSSRMENNIHTYDTILFNHFNEAIATSDFGYRHNVPVSLNIKTFSNFNIVPSLSYDGVLYTRSIKKWYAEVTDTIYDPESGDMLLQQRGVVMEDTIEGLSYGHSIKPMLTFSYNPKIYGMFQSVNPHWRIRAIRHVISPSASLHMSPDIRKLVPDYWDTVYRYNDPREERMEVYSRFQRGIYGTPSLNGKAATVNLGLRNTLEMKLRMPSDTTEEFKKISLLDRFDFSTNYNVFAEKFHWSDIRFSGGTRLLNNQIDIQSNANFDLYMIDSTKNGRYFRRDTFHYDVTGKLARLTLFSTSVGININNNLFTGKKNKNTTITHAVYDPYSYFDVPWNLGLNYDITYNKPYFQHEVIQTLSFNGMVSLTKNWRFNFNSGYDLKQEKFTITTMSFYRDLHCWEMSLNCSPFGVHKFYFFKINVKSQMLGDLKYEKRKDPRDY